MAYTLADSYLHLLSEAFEWLSDGEFLLAHEECCILFKICSPGAIDDEIRAEVLQYMMLCDQIDGVDEQDLLKIFSEFLKPKDANKRLWNLKLHMSQEQDTNRFTQVYISLSLLFLLF